MGENWGRKEAVVWEGDRETLSFMPFVVGDDWTGSELGMTSRGRGEFSSPQESAGLTWWDLVSTLGGASLCRTHVSLDPPCLNGQWALEFNS